MLRRTLPAAHAACAILAFLVVAATALAQAPLPDPSTELGDLLHRGYQLETQGRWGEALTFYEDALRRYPADAGLKRRFNFARLHYDVARRYADRSYLDLLGQVSLDQALDLYMEVLVKIQAHHVEAPALRALIDNGTDDLEVALGEPAFMQVHAPRVEVQAVGAFRAELRRVMALQAVQSRQDARDAVAFVAGLAQQRLGIAPNAVVMEYVCGAANCLDTYSSYLTPTQLSDVYSQIEGNFVGLGVELKADQGALLIVRVIHGSPAFHSGIRPGDRIIAVDGRTTAELSTDQAANLLQGPEGSIVELALQSPGQPVRQVVVRRQRVEVPSVDDVRMLDPTYGIAYLRLTCFQKTTSRDLDAALWNLHGQGMRSLIMDLRGNPGGLLVTAVEAADKFVSSGIIVSTRGRNLQEDFTYSAHESGTRSYGKGSVQGIFPLSVANAGLRLTTAKFYSPSGQPYSNHGVEPDVPVHLAARPVDGQRPSVAASPDNGADPMLEAALRAARRLVARR